MDLQYYYNIYRSALRIVLTKIEILEQDYKNSDKYNPIEHIKTRMKSEESIYNKLQRKGLEITESNLLENIEDVAGLRIICPFTTDIYAVIEAIKRQEDIKIVRESDYIKNPKPSGYRSYHMIVEVPVYLSEKTEYVKVEIQIRTQGMDFWGSLEHKAKYKYNGEVPAHLVKEFKVCAKQTEELDKRMNLINEIIQLINE